MKIVFLDIDGVLATSHTYNLWRRARWADSHPGVPFPQGRARRSFKKAALDTFQSDADLLDADCCARVQKLCDVTGASIVVSSSWRIFHTTDALRWMFESKGLTAPVLGTTPMGGDHRGTQILAVVTDMGLQPTDLVILEDEEDVRPFNGRRIQTTFDGARAGFQDRHLARAIKLLGG